ncbi:MAG: FtsX-like permease family protein [Myxococcota bacterium]
MDVLFTLALRNLVQARRRTALIATALGLVTVLMTLLLSLSQGLGETLLTSATTLSTGHVNVGGFFKLNARDASGVVADASKILAVIEKTLPDADYVTPRGRGWAKIVSSEGSMQSGIVGVDLDKEPHLLERLQIQSGDATQLADRGTALLFAAQAKKLTVAVGDVITLSIETFTGQRNTAEVRVVAIARDMGLLSNWSVIVPNSTIREMYGLKRDTTGAFQVYLKDVDEAPAAMQKLAEAMVASGFRVMDHEAGPFWMKMDQVSSEDWTGQKLDVTTWDDEASFLKWVVTALDTISFFLAAILLSIIGIGFMNTMWIAVRERTPEIGTMRAIGMRRRRVLALFLIEASVLGLVATGAGALVGAAIALAIDAAKIQVPYEAMRFILMSDVLHLAVQPAQLLLAVLAFTGITALAALWPAIRAARLSPVTAIGHAT